MEAACLRQTELPHTSRLFSDFLYHFDRVERFYRDGREAAKYPDERRAQLVAALAAQNGPSASLDLLARPGTVAVVTGQQVGLFSGPSYTIYKALTAIKLARRLTAEGRPAVPVFWLATEDHDFAEVNHAWVFDSNASPVRIEVEGPSTPDQPVGNIQIDSWHTEAFERALDGMPFAAEIDTAVRAAYRPGSTMGAAFHHLLKALLGQYGLLFIDPLQAPVRALAAPLLREAVEAAPELSRRLLERNNELTAAGYHTQVHIEPATSLFFMLDGQRRISLKRQNGAYVAKDRRYDASDLAGFAEHLSPNALLRPVMQDYLLPTSAYVGGPAELAYFAQSQVLYDALLGSMPHLVARAAFTLIDSRSAKLLERYGLNVPDFFHGEQELRERMAAHLVPPPLRTLFDDTNREVRGLMEKLEGSIHTFDPTLAAAAAKSRAKVQYQLGKIESKVARETMRRNDRAARDACWLYGNLFPHKHLQERFYTILPFLARHGLGLIEQLASAVHLDCPDHILLRIE